MPGRRPSGWAALLRAWPWAIVLTACAEPVTYDHGLAIENVSVVDVRQGRVAPGMTVVMQGTRIVAVRPAGSVRVGDSAIAVDGAGKYLVPGLWDMHVHAAGPDGEQALPLFVANGVTGIRDMWGDLAWAKEARRAIDSGERVGPRMVVAGNLVDGVPPWWRGSIVADSPERGRRVVDSLAAAGAAFIKVYSLLDTTTYGAILERSRAVGIPADGHVPFGVHVSRAAEAGQRSMEHLTGVVEGCSTADDYVRAERVAMLEARARQDPDARNPFFDPGIGEALTRSYDATLCAQVVEQLARAGSWQVPTMVVLRAEALSDDSAFTADPRLAYVDLETRLFWESVAALARTAPESDRATARRLYRTQLEVLRQLVQRGVPVLPGTDTPNPYAFAGFSLHDELEILVEAGYSPLQALRAATLAPAEFLGVTDTLGTVEVGMIADLLLLEGNPLEDIASTRRLSAVIANGRLFDRDALEGLLGDARSASGNQEADAASVGRQR